MGGEGGGLAGEEAEEEEGVHGGSGESVELPGSAQQVRHHPQELGRQASGKNVFDLIVCRLLRTLYVKFSFKLGLV